MDRISEIVLTDLRYQIDALGRDGGAIGPSVYDTAQVLRLAPPSGEHKWAALDWLIQQQHDDGGWGGANVPRARDVPTLAAVLALLPYTNRRSTRQAVEHGMAFLRRQSSQWAGALPDDLPVGVELLLPTLLDEAARHSLDLPHDAYKSLFALGRRRRRLIEQIKPGPASPAAHSWEAWGVEPDPGILDNPGSVGHNPAATAAWLYAAAARPDLAAQREQAQHYLAGAAGATGVNIAGVVPTVWPITRFEQSNALYALLIGGILHHPALRDVVVTQVAALGRAMRPGGLGFSDWFAPDGDDTAEALAVLRACDQPMSIATMQHFACEDHYCAYPGELQSSISVTTHAAHVLASCGADNRSALAYLLERQLPDGRWPGDKWNGAWLYTTSHALVVLCHTPNHNAV
ncbi:MAG: hypothetical protein H7Y32_13595, partial [Chloroflexales bacterium]|nr:hypothetical protein [Chloroflexales bacterium]